MRVLCVVLMLLAAPASANCNLGSFAIGGGGSGGGGGTGGGSGGGTGGEPGNGEEEPAKYHFAPDGTITCTGQCDAPKFFHHSGTR